MTDTITKARLDEGHRPFIEQVCRASNKTHEDNIKVKKFIDTYPGVTAIRFVQGELVIEHDDTCDVDGLLEGIKKLWSNDK